MDNNFASYYLTSPVFMEMTKSKNFKSLTKEEILIKHYEYLRDDSEIKNIDDFLTTLVYITFGV
jgi:hypothetical protein